MRLPAFVVAPPVALAVTLLSCSAHAQAAAARTDDDVRARIAYLDSRLASGEASASRWSWAWVGIYSALAAGNFVIAGLSNSRDSRVDFIARGSLSTIGLATTVLLWPHAASAKEAPRLLPGDTPEQQGQKLTAYEASLAKANRGDAFGTSWKAHLIGFGVNGLAGAAVAVLDERPKHGALVFLGGFIVAEIKILTRPTPSLRTKEAYEAMPAATPISSVSLYPTSNGVTALGAF